MYYEENSLFRENSDYKNDNNLNHYHFSEIPSFVLGVVGFVVLFFLNPIFAIPVSAVGIFFGIHSNSKVNATMNIIVLVTSIVFLFITLLEVAQQM